MLEVSQVEPLRARTRDWLRAGQDIAFVPTMGNLHPGHLRLVEHARCCASRVVVSIFVNPMQFGPGEDFASYPRTLDEDRAALAHCGVDLLFTPAVTTLYPRGIEQTTRVDVPGVSEGLCADFRPGHFTGVATVVARLFNLVQPQVAVFGEKDYQQLAVIRRMVGDLCWPIRVESVATVREADGLAMSSRNRYLDADERRRAPQLHRTLQSLAERIRGGGESYRALETQAMGDLRAAGFVPDYVSIRHADTLEAVADGERHCVVLAAAYLGKARLIDNIRV